MLFDPQQLIKANTPVATEVKKASFDLDMQIINFIVNCLLPYSAEMQQI